MCRHQTASASQEHAATSAGGVARDGAAPCSQSPPALSGPTRGRATQTKRRTAAVLSTDATPLRTAHAGWRDGGAGARRTSRLARPDLHDRRTRPPPAPRPPRPLPRSTHRLQRYLIPAPVPPLAAWAASPPQGARAAAGARRACTWTAPLPLCCSWTAGLCAPCAPRAGTPR